MKNPIVGEVTVYIVKDEGDGSEKVTEAMVMDTDGTISWKDVSETQWREKLMPYILERIETVTTRFVAYGEKQE